MTISRLLLLAGATLSFLLACGLPQTDRPVSARGAELLVPFKSELKKALVAGMQQGPANAINVCRDQAPMIAASLATAGVRIGRTSHRLRNPENAGPDWVDAVLQTYLGDTQNLAPQVVELPGDREGYVEPILTQPLCLACHGESVAPEVAAVIAETLSLIHISEPTRPPLLSRMPSTA